MADGGTAIPGIVGMAAEASKAASAAGGALSGGSPLAGELSPLAVIQRIGAEAGSFIASNAERSLARTAARRETLRGRRIALEAQEELNRVLAGQAVSQAASGVGSFGGSGLALAGDAMREAGDAAAFASFDARLRSGLLKGESRQANVRANRAAVGVGAEAANLLSSILKGFG